MSSLHAGEPYQYTTLCNPAVGSVVHVFGIVSYIGRLSTTRKGDHCLPITLVDESVDVSSGGLKCNIFGRDVGKLPPQNCIGKVLRLHRLMIDNYRQLPQGTGNCGHGKLSWVLFPRGLPDKHPISGTANYTCTVSDIRRCEELYVWWDLVEAADRKRKTATAASSSSKLALIQDLWPGDTRHDFFVQVISIYIFPGETSTAMLRVWDGTPCRYKSCHVVPHMLDTAPVKTANVTIPERYLVDVYAFGNHVVQTLKLNTFDFVHLRDVNLKPLSARVVETVESNCAYRFQEPYREYMQFLLHSGIQADKGIFPCSATSQEGVKLRKRLRDVLESELPEDMTATEDMQQLLHSVNCTPSNTVEEFSSAFTLNVRTSSPSQGSGEKETEGWRMHYLTPPGVHKVAVEQGVESTSGQQHPVQTNSSEEDISSAEELVVRLLQREKTNTGKMSLVSELRPSAHEQHLIAEVLECQVSSLRNNMAILTVWDGTPISYAFQGIFLPEAVTVFYSTNVNHLKLNKRYKLPICIVGKRSERVHELKPLDIVRFTNLRTVLTRKPNVDPSLRVRHSFQAYCLLGEEKSPRDTEMSVVNVDSPQAFTLIERLQSMQQLARSRDRSKESTEQSAENNTEASVDELMATANRQQSKNPSSHYLYGEIERTRPSQAIPRTPKTGRWSPQSAHLVHVDPPSAKSRKKEETKTNSPKPGPSWA